MQIKIEHEGVVSVSVDFTSSEPSIDDIKISLARLDSLRGVLERTLAKEEENRS